MGINTMYITMENHNFQWVNPLFLWSFSSSQTFSHYQRVFECGTLGVTKKWSIHHNKMTMIFTGWWYTYPSEKWDSQLGWLFPILMEKIIQMFQTTNQMTNIFIIWILNRDRLLYHSFDYPHPQVRIHNGLTTCSSFTLVHGESDLYLSKNLLFSCLVHFTTVQI